MTYTTHVIRVTKSIRRNLVVSESEDDFLRGDSPLAAVSETENACREILFNPEFRRTLEYHYELKEQHKDDVQHLMTDEKAFYSILDKDMIMLREANADDQLIKLIRNESRNLFSKKRLNCFNFQQVCTSLYGIQKVVSGVRKDLEENVDKQNPTEKMWRNKIKYAVVGLGGVALVGLNASAFAVSLGLGAAATAVSGSIGGGLIGVVLSKMLLDDPKPPASNEIPFIVNEDYIWISDVEIPRFCFL